jgi:hypothetical protein
MCCKKVTGLEKIYPTFVAIFSAFTGVLSSARRKKAEIKPV